MSRVPYSLAVGSLMYAMVCTRPTIAHVVGVVSRYMNNPGKEHWEAVKWILRYLRGIANHVGKYLTDNECFSLMESTTMNMAWVQKVCNRWAL
jgi:hypothetical protein